MELLPADSIVTIIIVYMLQSISQSINESNSESNNGSNNESNNESINQSINQRTRLIKFKSCLRGFAANLTDCTNVRWRPQTTGHEV